MQAQMRVHSRAYKLWETSVIGKSDNVPLTAPCSEKVSSRGGRTH
jgi:hypothetical protein